jgi:alanyl-tRNA synthetase
MKNHTATHLLQSALIKLLGKQIKQSGSLVTHDYLRFDFNFHENLTPGMIKELEDTVNQKIWDDIEVKTRQTTLDEAKKLGIIAHFGEKYNPEAVRVIDATEFSRELCGGTHVNRTGEIGCFKITDVSAISAGTKRITAITGPKALELFQSCFRTVKAVSQEYKVQPDEVYETVEHQIELTKKLHKEVAQLKKQLVIYQLPELLNDLETINDIPFLYLEQHGSTINDLRELAQSLSQKKEGFYFAISTVDGKSNFVATIHPTLKKKVNLKSLAQFLKEKHNLRGGGSTTIIQGGGDEIKNIKDEIKNWLKNNK